MPLADIYTYLFYMNSIPQIKPKINQQMQQFYGGIIMEFDLLSQMTSPALQTKRLETQILELRERAISYGIVISPSDASALAAVGAEQLHEQERVEFARSAVVKIISKFMESAYISQSDFVETVSGLIEIFYAVKEESLDILSDDDVISAMFDCFENISNGDVELLSTRDLERLIRRARGEAFGVDFDEDE